MNFRRIVFASIAFVCMLTILQSCQTESDDNVQTAKKYCSSCHLFPEPSLLDKVAWEKKILPAMASRLGIRYFLDSPYEAGKYVKGNNPTLTAENEVISISDWKKIISYYKDKAPATDAAQNRPPVEKFTDRFTAKEVYSKEINPSVTYIKIDEGNQWIYTANANDSSLSIYNQNLQLLSKVDLHGVMVDMQCNESMQSKGERSGILTNIGILNPNDLSTGTADSFKISKDGTITFLKQFLGNMPRPVQTTMIDLDHDGRQDYLVSGFGNTKGGLYWMKDQGNHQYQQNFIRATPGTIKTYTDDYNHDGLPDIMALMAQAQEGVYLFTNRGNGTFDSKTILQFPSVYGSSYFELDDFNNDGFKDILYTCGDNADYTYNSLKNYHGVYIFLNDGKYNFKQQYFFPIHGCYKAIARDFDNDGDLDIATISFFPDRKNQPQESFVYLENKGNTNFGNRFQFQPYSIREFNAGKWLTMDAGDIDADGDEDIVLGNFLPPDRDLQLQAQGKAKPAFLCLENKTKSASLK